MFALLNEYDSQAFYEEHPRMYLVTPEGGYEVEIFAAFAAEPSESGSDASPWRLEWKDDGDYTTWITSMKESSLIETDGDHFEDMRSLNQEMTFEAAKKQFAKKDLPLGEAQMKTLGL